MVDLFPREQNMKIIIVVFLTAVAFDNLETVSALDRIKDYASLKERVESAMDDLEIHYLDKVSSIDEILNNFISENMQNINVTVHDILDAIQNEIKTAERHGVNADHCFEQVKLRFLDVASRASSRVKECTYEQHYPLEEAKRQFANISAEGKTLLSDLKKMAADCTNIPLVEIQICINPRLPRAHNKVGRYESRVESMREYGEFSISATSTMLEQCLRTLISEFDRSLSSPEISITTCLENASSLSFN